ncbi:MAG: hypothetical protein FWC91_12390 [Defluviitaleaceae bacterium]|nr:hypothetical protein [Defluviitaleaceae bacterium]
MRVTNWMQHNQSLNNINRNMRNLQRLYEQTTSQKVISRPSQDPLVANRAMRFRTRLSNVEQHQRNVESAHAWMNVSESSLFNLLRDDDSIFAQIKDELLRAVTGSNVMEDKMVMITAIENLIEQIALEMNQTYDGRYVFAGWRTDQPPFLMRDMPGESHVITQNFNVRDIERTYSFQRFAPDDIYHRPVNIIKLPFPNRNLNFTDPPPPPLDDPALEPAPGVPAFGIEFVNGAGVQNIVPQPRSINDVDAYIPAPGEIFYIVETGELVFHPDLLDDIEDGIEITYQVSDLRASDINPFVYFDTWSTVPRTNNPPIFHWPQEPDQEINFEFSPGSTTQINVLSRDIITANMIADLRRVVEFTRSLSAQMPDRRELEEIYRQNNPGLSNERIQELVAERMSDEITLITEMLDGPNGRLRNMIRFMDDFHKVDATREHTSLGSRMRRVEMFEIRLEDAEHNYSRLKSENEDVDMHQALVRQAIAEAAYQQALRAIANNIQLALINFV